MTTETEIKRLLANEEDATKQVDILTTHAYEIRNTSPTSALEIAEYALQKANDSNYTKGRADSLLIIGFCNMHAAHHEKAFESLFESIEIYRELGDETGISNAEYNIGVVHLRIGNFDDAIKMFQKSLAFRENQNDLSGMAACYFQMSYIHQHFNNQEGSYEAATRSLELREQLKDDKGIAASLMVLGEVYLKRKDFEKAREIIARSMELRKRSDEALGYFATMLRWTELHLLLQEYDKAQTFAEEGLAMAQTESVNFGVIRFLQMLGKIALIRNDVALSKKHHLEALAYSEKYSFKSIIYEQHEALAELLQLEGNYKEALEHYRKFHTAKEYLVNFQSNTRIQSTQFLNQIESARREAELEKEKHAALNEAYKIISEKQKEILDSIHYAKRIQRSLLASETYIKRNLDKLNKT